MNSQFIKKMGSRVTAGPHTVYFDVSFKVNLFIFEYQLIHFEIYLKKSNFLKQI